jgi:outer membrane protein OmpA-like peptidoglycan-associated protein
VSSVREGLRVRVPAHVVFVTDSTGIRPEASYLLGELTQVLKDVPSARLTVLVYSDALDDSASTRAFTAARALAVEGLLQQQGVPGARLQAQGGGQAEPLGGNDTPEQRQANRRLEILISPLSF